MADYIRCDDPEWNLYEIELDGKFLDKKKVWDACESKGYINKIIRDASVDEWGYITRPAFTQKAYGRVFIVRMSPS